MTAAADQRAGWLALCEAATPGPWRHYYAASLREDFGSTPVNEVQTGTGDAVVAWSGFDSARSDRKHQRADAAFIAAAREAVPALIQQVEALDAIVALAGEVVGRMDGTQTSAYRTDADLCALRAALRAALTPPVAP